MPFPKIGFPRFEQAIHAMDAYNHKDPRTIEYLGKTTPYEIFYAEELNRWVYKLCQAPSEDLLLAARAMHIGRWMIARDTYPMTRAGYHQWRKELQSFHAEKAGKILAQEGYPSANIEKIQELICKKNLGKDPDTQILEDALALTFINCQLSDFAIKNPPEKVITVIKKTLKKMSDQAIEYAKQIKLSDDVRPLVAQALSP